MSLAVVRDLREQHRPATAEDLADFETDLLAGFVMARASAGLVDSTIRNDTNHLSLIRDWFGRPLWEMQPKDADSYFGKVLRTANRPPAPVARLHCRCFSSSSSCVTRSNSTTSPAA